ncbi:ASST-domain-containing protein [Stachybotrys elegans]|uniref:ASST-domain-containing protein n=1 Tax=Stachybotrys elegans TaxID=80388 RepID=A0A8K0SK41_9HYPO|nr:ASST-domain-containing protein [Stachybotrys elegans]
MRHLSFLTALLSVATLTRADEPIFLNSKEYDNGDFGPYPIQHFKATGHRAPRVNLVRQSDRCDHDLYTFFSPRGFANNARLAQSTILDQNGHLVWTTSWGENQQMYNLQVQEYKGNKYLTFWAGNDAVGGHGAGKYYMLDQSYKKFKEIDAVNGLKGDLHEFTITEQGTAIITAYKVVDVDLSSLGKTTGPIWECLFQEIDIETGDLVFEWRASEHIAVANTYRHIGGEGNPHGAAFDYRYLHSVTYIDGRTGDVIWVLGGKKNMFDDLSDGRATSFGFQHDARWANNYTEMTIFDNSDDGGFSDKSHPRGVRVKIDQEAMTAELVQEYKNPTRLAAASQGSMRDLPNGNVLLGFGNAPLFTEFSHDGEVLCETHFGPANKFGSGEAQSYRVLKFAWQGFPTSDPAVAIKQDDADEWRVYVSWNGATEIVQWVLQGADKAEGQEEQWQMLEAVAKDGFETSFLVKPGHPAWLRALAMDGSGNVLGMTATLISTSLRPRSLEPEWSWPLE